MAATRKRTRQAGRELRRDAAAIVPAELPRLLRGAVLISIGIIAVLIVGAAVAAFTESYRGLFDWFHQNGFRLAWAAIGPLMVDVFVAVGELTLFVLTALGFPWYHRLPAWAITFLGVAASVAGNIGHTWIHGRPFSAPVSVMATNAVPPLAAAAALAVGIGLFKKLITLLPAPPAVAPGRVQGDAEQPPTEHHEPRRARQNAVTAKGTPNRLPVVIPDDLPDGISLEDRARLAITAHVARHGEPPSERSVAADLLGNPNRRRTAKTLIAEVAGTSDAEDGILADDLTEAFGGAR